MRRQAMKCGKKDPFQGYRDRIKPSVTQRASIAYQESTENIVGLAAIFRVWPKLFRYNTGILSKFRKTDERELLDVPKETNLKQNQLI